MFLTFATRHHLEKFVGRRGVGEVLAGAKRLCIEGIPYVRICKNSITRKSIFAWLLGTGSYYSVLWHSNEKFFHTPCSNSEQRIGASSLVTVILAGTASY